MAMRITTKMMQNTSLRNLNTNKALEEKLTNQLATGKKIDRPSDDPVIAIRSLRLNASLDKVEQYYEKNASDAKNWLEITESGIRTVNTILETDVKQNIVNAKSSYKTADQRKDIIRALKDKIGEIYSIGNADSAGRTVFTGYRTDMPLAFKEDKTEKYTITQQLTNLDIDKYTFVSTGMLKNINEGNFNKLDENQYKVSTNDIYRIRLAYSNIDLEESAAAKAKYGSTTSYGAYINVGYMKGVTTTIDGANLVGTSFVAYANIDTTGYRDKAVIKINDLITGAAVNFTGYTVVDGTNGDVEFDPSKTGEITLAKGTTVSVSGYNVTFTEDGKVEVTRLKQNGENQPQESVSIGYDKVVGDSGKTEVKFDDKYLTSMKVDNFYPSSTSDAAYQSVMDNPDQMTYLADTGELLLGKNIQKRLSELANDTELRVTYDKSEWKKNDLDPIHYFYTEKKATDNTDRMLKYNENFLVDPTASGKQIIEYDVGNNQSLRVNTTADEFLNHDMGRDAEEVITMLEEYGVLDDCYNTIDSMIKSEKYVGDDLTKLQQELEAIEKARTMVGDKITNRCDELLKNCELYLKRGQTAETNCGNRGSRLELVKNRLNVQKTSFEELVGDNEDASYEELAIQMKAIQMTYQAALSSISYVLQTSLLDFIR